MWFLILLVGFSFSLQISLKDALELALKNNRTLKKLERELSSAVYREKLSLWERFSPETDVRVSRDRLELVARVLLLEFGRRTKNIKAEEHRKKIAELTLLEFKNRLKIEVTDLYIKLLLYDVMAQEKREFMAVAFVRFDREREKMKLGLSDRVKVSELEKVYRKYRKELFEVQRKYNETLYRLKRYLGLKMEEDLEIKPLKFRIPFEKNFKEKVLLDKVKNNYKLKIKNQEIAYYRELEKGERTLFKPEVVLEGRFGRDFDEKDYYTKFNTYINIPILDPRPELRRKTLKEKRLALMREYRELEEEVKERVYTFPYIWDEIRENYKYAKTYFNWAENNLEKKRSEYELQLAFDLGYAMAHYTEAERKLLEVNRRALLFLMEVYHTVGEDPVKALGNKHPFLE
ncbi:TolC family protein [Aquifex aeolicus]|uniref:TolC family protein n=1 Tax=Aquifex aeolicus (strain VF5) TaxID=224324 RepID=O67586_AQUAE|nr:TolC family protein [Aquifex aeolicus]AAC07554.1 putative protein [Aquifex aeolicus VF5]